MDLSISIVSYNTKDFLVRCLESINKYTQEIKFEIIVVDNDSNDGTSEIVKRKFPKVKIVSNKKNLFFAEGNNQALKIALGKFFLVLAPDSYFVDDSLKKIVDFLVKNPKVGAIDGLELYEDKTIVPTGSLFSTPLIDFYELSLLGKRVKNEKVLKHFRLKSKDRKKNFEIDVGCDAFLCVRTDIMKKIDGYDTNLLLYYTENDLCLRIKKLGYKIIHLGDAKVVHKVSVSAKKMGWMKFDIYYRDLLTYYLKHGYKISGTLLYILLKFEELLLKVFKPETIK